MIVLNKEPTKPFVVLNLTDIQIRGNDILENTECYRLFVKTVKELVSCSNPQLITISGDISYGDADNYLDTYRAIGMFIESFQIDWALVFGNHDNQGGPEHIRNIVEMYHAFPHFRYESGDEALGNGNYVISIDENGKTVAGILMMDTHDRVAYTDVTGETSMTWAKLIPEQLEWYKAQIKALDYKNTVLITHIPIYAYSTAFREAFSSIIDPKSITLDQSYNGDCWNEGFKDSFGVRYEKECCYPEDEGMFDAVQNMHSTKLILCGHDHANCWSIKYHGVRLMYALKTGRGSYWHQALNGGTVLKINNDGTVVAEHISVNSES